MKKSCLLLLGVIFLLCASCAVTADPSEKPAAGEYEVYFVSNVRSENGESWGSADSGALKSESRTIEEGVEPIGGLLGLLMSQPNSGELTSPFPADVRVRSWRLEGTRVTVDLSERYGELAGIELTLADSCIVLTLCQLDEVEEVYLTVEGRRRAFRDQVYTAADFIENNRVTPAPNGEEVPADGEADGEEAPLERSLSPQEEPPAVETEPTE